MKKILFRIAIILVFLHVLFYGLFYLFQEKVIFLPTGLDKDYAFSFDQPFEEINVGTEDGKILNGLLFKADTTKGVIFYLHGNAGTLADWGRIAPVYTDLGYDIFFIDYRGFGKSDGKIESQQQLFDDVQIAYNKIKELYDEDKITIMGFSIGTGPAAYLASVNNPSRLILQAPYYDLTDVIQRFCPVMPGFLVRYKLETYRYLDGCSVPVTIFHGDKDRTINYENSVKLSKLLKENDNFITLSGESHNGITNNGIYKQKLAGILE
ncbi:hypothetical protein GGR21_001725 [Dysgonomonas hofstadii]|uniref:AB hydrolase-1 domain-containing protein n=1 Tax=Dysgonomonas hofstadii TaxID=637886 RepID=A0A840CIP0_9BACT|nr:alpha/beta fold hydrolase [Dysgonomonas hofstadii]MBB4035830.1 hypothetical protein [Dysgonomonas hofstadii]